jgi:hypothetical protein
MVTNHTFGFVLGGGGTLGLTPKGWTGLLREPCKIYQQVQLNYCPSVPVVSVMSFCLRFRLKKLLCFVRFFH